MANSLVKRIWGTAVSKTDDKRLPVIDMEKNLESLKPSDKYYYKKFNRLNKERWEVHTAHRKSHNKFATVLAIFSVGICILYSVILQVIIFSHYFENHFLIFAPPTSLAVKT